jgi:hypothetical protein
MTMAGDILHDMPGTSFAVWEAPTARQPRFAVIEPGAGRRGAARRRGTARTLAAAADLTASLVPSTAAEILAGITTWGERDRERVATLVALGQPGARLWIICDGYGYEAVSEGLAVSGVEAMFGEPDNELACWMIRWRDPSGEECTGMYAVALADAERAWWVLDADGRVIAGGPPIYCEARALEIAAELAGRAVHGTDALPGKAA